MTAQVEPGRLLTFLFADMEGSTRHLERLGTAYGLLLARYHDIVGTAVSEHGGTVVSTQGDGHFACFDNTSQALRAALEIQRSLETENWPAGSEVKARIGIHIGEAQSTSQGLVGLDLHRAARVSSAAHGGQVLITAAAAGVADMAAVGARVIDLGEHRLKDLSTPLRLYQLAAPGVTADFPPLRSLPALGHNLPIELTSFVGRAPLVADLQAALGGQRLTTLTGFGGVGKTRLAIQTGAAAIDLFPDGVWLTDLTSVRDPHLVPLQIATALGLSETPGADTLQLVIDHLAHRRLLLILDNCEHLTARIAEIIEAILGATEGVVVLATSRRSLGVRGELVHNVEPFDVTAITAGSFLDSPAVRLFAERAAAVDPEFVIDDRNGPAVRRICRLTDGLPLAIELAAARLRVLSPAELADRIEQRLTVLAQATPSLAAHHATLEATMQWSYDLLGPQDQTLFRRLSVFQGTFTLEAVETVCAEGADLLDAMERLVDASMVRVVRGETTRYLLLETLRRYAATLLADDPLHDEVRRRHARHYRALVQGGGAALLPPDQARWMALVDADHDNLRAALDWSFGHPDEDLAVGLTGDLARYWYRKGLLSEGRRWFDLLAKWPGLPPSKELATALRFAIALHLDAGATAQAEALVPREARVAEHVGDPGVLARSLNVRGGIAWRRGDLARAAAVYTDASRLLEEGRDPLRAQLLINRAFVAIAMGDLDEAAALASAISDLAAHSGTELPEVHRVLGEIAFASGDLSRGRDELRRAVAAFRRLEFDLHLAKALQSLATVEVALGDVAAARAAATESLELYAGSGDRFNHAQTLSVMADVLTAEGRTEDSWDALAAALTTFAGGERPDGVITALIGLAAHAAERGEWARSARLDAMARRLERQTGFALPHAVRDERRGRARIQDDILGPDATEVRRTAEAITDLEAMAAAALR